MNTKQLFFNASQGGNYDADYDRDLIELTENIEHKRDILLLHFVVKLLLDIPFLGYQLDYRLELVYLVPTKNSIDQQSNDKTSNTTGLTLFSFRPFAKSCAP